MPYELISDGTVVPLGNRRYLLSPQDLAGLEVIADLVQAGVTSLKIEGRLKTPEYVANITRLYRLAIDRCVDAPHLAIRPPTIEASGTNPRYDMEMAFSRGLSTGWLRGIDNQKLVHARFGKKRGVYLGEVSRIQSGRVSLRLEGPLKPGDGIVFDSGHPESKEEGGRVYALHHGSGSAETAVTFGRGDLDLSRVRVGDKVWKTSDPELDRRLRRSFTGDEPKFRRPLHLEIYGSAGEVAVILARDELGHLVEVRSKMPLVTAQTQPLTTDRLQTQLGRLGGTPFRLDSLKCHLQGPLMLPVSELNHLRREFTEQLSALRSQPKRWTLNLESVARLNLTDRPHRSAPSAPTLNALVRSLPQLEAALESTIQTVYCDFEDPKKYRQAVQLFRQHTAKSAPDRHRAIFVAPPRIFKMGEEWTLKQVQASEADGYLVRNYDHLKFFAASRRIGDFSLNVANPLSAQYFVERFGLDYLTASYDLNIAQLSALLRAAPPEWFEITIHQHIPMFHMEHCVFCAFLSNGTDYTNCGRPCDKHEVNLRDRVGMEHPLKADVGCRNTLFNARAQTGAEYVSELLSLGARRFRLEFLNESPAEVSRTIDRYQELLHGRISGTELWREFKLVNQLGVTRGPLAK
jgi:putative protease